MPSGLKTRKLAPGRQAQHPSSRFRHGFFATRRFSSGNKLRGEKYDGRMADVWSCGVILYALLVGALPFDDDNLRNLLEKVKKGVFHIPPFVSPDCQSLLRAMIEVNPRKRITLKEVLEHRWVTSDTSMPLQLELPMTQAVQTAVIPTRADIDPDIFGTMTSLQCFRDQEKLVEELLSPVHNTEKVIYFLLLDRKLRNPSADDPEEIRSRSSTLNLNSSKADPPRKRIDSLKLTLNGSSRLSLGNLSEGSPLSGRRGLAVQKLRKKSFSSGLDSQSSTPAVSPLGSPLSLQRVHCRTVSCESTGTILSSPNSLAIPSPHRAQAPTISRHPPTTIPTPVAAVCSDNGVQNTVVSVHPAGKTLHSVPSEAVGIPVVSAAVGHPQHGLNFYCFGSIPPLGPGAQHLMHPPMGPLPVPTTMATPFVPALHLLPHLHPHPFTGGPYLIPTMPPFPTPLPPMPSQPLTQQQQQNPSTASILPPGSTLKSPTHSKPTQAVIEQTSPLATTPVNVESDGHSSVASTINCAESASPASTEELITADGQIRLDASTSRPTDSPGPSDRQPNEGRTKTYSPVSQVSAESGCNALRTVSPNTAPSSPVDLISSRPKRSSIPSSPPAYVNRHNRDAYPVQPINLSHNKQAHFPSSTTNDKTRANGSALCSPTPSVRSIKSPLLYSSSSSTSPSADKRKTIHGESPRTNVDSRSTASPSLSSPNSRTGHIVTSTPSSTPSATTPTSPNASNQPWRAKLTNLKMSFLGSPRFHRKKSGLVEETPPSSPKVSGFVHNRQTNTGRSVPSEPSPLLTHKSWFDGFLSAASGHVIFKGSQHAFNAAAAAEDAAALAISTNAKSKELSSDESPLSKVNNSPDLSATPPLDNLAEETCMTADSPTSSVTTNDEVNATNNDSQSNRIRTNRQVTIHEPPVSAELKVGTSKTPDTAGLSNKPSNERRSGKATTATSNASAVPEETNHVVMIKGRALNRLKAELVQVFLATPGVVHTVISPTSFRAEYRRTGSGSTLLARPVKLQVDMVRATGGISTGSTSGKSLCSVPSEREVYAVNFQLLSGPTRRFKRLCDQLQTALLAGPSQPNFSTASAISNGCGTNKSLMSDHSHTHPPASGRCVSLAEREDGLVNSHPRSEIIRNIQAKSPELSGCWKSDEPDSSNSETANHSQPPASPKQFTLQTSPVTSMVGRLENNGIGNKAFDNSGECKG